MGGALPVSLTRAHGQAPPPERVPAAATPTPATVGAPENTCSGTHRHSCSAPAPRDSLISSSPVQYNVLAWKSCENFAERLAASDPGGRFRYLPTVWDKFDDSKMDHIIVGGFTPKNVIARSHVLFLASFDDK